MFIAHSLAGLPSRPPITLMMHGQGLYESFHEASRVVKVMTHGSQLIQSNFDVELLREEGWSSMRNHRTDDNAPVDPEMEEDEVESRETVIQNLILTTKANNTITALRSVAHRLRPSSTILFLQNGMGLIEEVNKEIFPDVASRPYYMAGVVSHGIIRLGEHRPWLVEHTGYGTISLGLIRDLEKQPLPAKPELDSKVSTTHWPVSARYLLRTITRSPVLAAAGFPETDLKMLQLEKLAANALINPLTSLIDCENGELLYNTNITFAIRLLLVEISTVIRGLPELRGIPGVEMRFSPRRLESLTFGIATRTAKNSSSMRQDVLRGKDTEVEYINGYIVKRGEEQGIKCVMNYLIVQLLKGKSQQVARRFDEYVPVEIIE